MTKKYAHGSGSYGCLYDSASGPFDTLQAAVDSAAEMFQDDLDQKQCNSLRRALWDNLYSDLPKDLGADYIEIFEVAPDWTWD